MRQATTAYPRVANRTYVKYVVIVGVLLLVVVGLMHVQPESSSNADGTMAAGESSLRGL